MTTKQRFRAVDVQLNQYVIMQVLDCWNCAIAFAITDDLETRRRRDGRAFYCPNGHANYFTDTEEEQLKRKLEIEKRHTANLEESLRIERAEAELQRRRAAAYKGHLTRWRKRIANGVCPCCNRSFVNVRRHMADKHPDVLDRVRRDENERPNVIS